MPKQTLYRWLIVSVAMLWMSACSHMPGGSDIPPGANFTTKILADDTKLFVYSQRFARRGAGGETEEEMSGRGESVEHTAQLAQISLRGVKAMLAQNHYCRDDFVVLEQYEQHGSYIVRGECRDAANTAERSKFSQ